MTRGFWQMHCFNALSEVQQIFLVTQGYLPIGYQPEAVDGCQRPAEVEVTTQWDLYPGPRFYCRVCAIRYLRSIGYEERYSRPRTSKIESHGGSTLS